MMAKNSAKLELDQITYAGSESDASLVNWVISVPTTSNGIVKIRYFHTSSEDRYSKLAEIPLEFYDKSVVDSISGWAVVIQGSSRLLLLILARPKVEFLHINFKNFYDDEGGVQMR